MKILIIKHGSLGDVIMSLGAIKSIKLFLKHEKLFLLTQTNYKKILNNAPYIDHILVDDRKNIIISSLKIAKLLKKYQINLVIDLQNSTRTRIYGFIIRFLSNSNLLSTNLFSNYKHLPKKFGTQHVSKNHYDQIKILGIKNYFLPDLDWMEKIKRIKKKYVILIPGASKSGYYKKWPSYKFARIAQFLIEKKYEVYLTGSILDLDEINKILEICPLAKNKISESRINKFYYLCQSSSLIISNDTGPAHIAGLSNTPLIWLANKNNISKSCYPLGINVHKILSKNVKDITETRVIKKINALL